MTDDGGEIDIAPGMQIPNLGTIGEGLVQVPADDVASMSERHFFRKKKKKVRRNAAVRYTANSGGE